MDCIIDNGSFDLNQLLNEIGGAIFDVIAKYKYQVVDGNIVADNSWLGGDDIESDV